MSAVPDAFSAWHSHIKACPVCSKDLDIPLEQITEGDPCDRGEELGEAYYRALERETAAGRWPPPGRPLPRIADAPF